VQPFESLIGIAAPMRISNLDTDVMIRIERLTAFSRNALGPYAFEALRLRSDGSENPEFVLNQPQFRGARILVAGENFGCGSSREAAVWALQGCGIQCVIAASFGDLFYSNCMQNGLLAARTRVAETSRLMDLAEQAKPFMIDLQGQCIRVGEEAFAFDIDQVHKDALLAGVDPLGVTLGSMASIRDWQAKDMSERPWAWPTADR
jgi:3-isopropylmalate/(R)-2-methylmalate dehydratase small subunit